MKKQHVFATLAALVFTFTNTAHAEGVFGAYAGPSKVELTGAGTLRGSLDESGTEFGVFGQWRNEMFGLHVGLGTNSTEINGTITPDSTQNPSAFKTEAGLAYELLGMLIIEGESINGIGMLGFSSLEAESTGALFGKTRSSGLKFAGGIEIPFANDAGVVQLMYERADLGEIEIAGTALKFEVEQSGFRLRIGMQF